MDGFNQDAASDRWAYTQLQRSQLPNYWHWAKQFVLADRFFSSAQGPSFPNHLYAIAAQSGGAHDNPRRTGAFRSSNTFGCDAPKGQTVTIVDSEGKEQQVQPCFNFRTEGDLLNGAGISPYALRGRIDGRLGEFSSVLRFIEDDSRLGRLTGRDRAAGNLAYDFDFTQKPRRPDPLPLRTDC